MTGLAERLAKEIVRAMPSGAPGNGSTWEHYYIGLAAEAVRRTIALAAGVVEEMAEDQTSWDDPVGTGGEPFVLREAQRKILALLDGEEKP